MKKPALFCLFLAFLFIPCFCYFFYACFCCRCARRGPSSTHPIRPARTTTTSNTRVKSPPLRAIRPCGAGAVTWAVTWGARSASRSASRKATCRTINKKELLTRIRQPNAPKQSIKRFWHRGGAPTFRGMKIFSQSTYLHFFPLNSSSIPQRWNSLAFGVGSPFPPTRCILYFRSLITVLADFTYT